VFGECEWVNRQNVGLNFFSECSGDATRRDQAMALAAETNKVAAGAQQCKATIQQPTITVP
jgi:hypothetical protein